MKIRPFDILKDYPEYARWWSTIDAQPPVVQDLAPVGFVVDSDGIMKYVGFLYFTDSSWSVFAFNFANPGNTPKETHTALRMVIEAAKQITVAQGRTQIFVYSEKSGIVKVLERAGFYNVNGHMRWCNE